MTRAAWNAKLDPIPDDQRLALDLPEVARRTRCSVRTLIRHIGRGNLKARKLGHRTVILPEDLDQFLRDLPLATARPR